MLTLDTATEDAHGMFLGWVQSPSSSCPLDDDVAIKEEKVSCENEEADGMFCGWPSSPSSSFDGMDNIKEEEDSYEGAGDLVETADFEDFTAVKDELLQFKDIEDDSFSNTKDPCSPELSISNPSSDSFHGFNDCEIEESSSAASSKRLSLVSFEPVESDVHEVPKSASLSIKETSVVHRCRYCGKVCAATSTLALHERTHTGEKPHQCHLCPKAFNSKGTLRRHVMAHKWVRPHSCSVCNRTFTAKSNLQAHARSHDRYREHALGLECTQCGTAFARSSELSMHLRVHSQERTVGQKRKKPD